MAKDKKINLLFDATIIVNAYDKKQSNRSGIFFVALNVLRQLSHCKDITIYLYSQNLNLERCWNKIKKQYFQDQNSKRILPHIPGIKEKINYKIIKNREKLKYFCKKNKILRCTWLKMKIALDNFLYQLLKVIIKEDAYSNVDVFLSPVFPVPDVIHNNKKIKKYIFLYDLIPYIFPDKYKEHLKPTTWFSKLLGSLSNDEIYFAISECTKRDFLKYFPKLKEENIVVTLLGYNENFYKADAQSQSMVRQKYGIPLNGKYVFSLCNIEERKNLIREIKTFADFINKNHIDDMYFVLGGAKVQSFIEIFEKSIDSLDFVKNMIIRAGYIDDEDLAPLYSGAEWFVYTSQYEGFGLPPLEAMACGCPVITSNSSSLPEVVGDAGIMIDWDSDKQHIQAYEKYYFDKKLRAKMSKKGLERSKLFSWEKTVDVIVSKIISDMENLS